MYGVNVENKKLKSALSFVKRKQFLRYAVLPENKKIEEIADSNIALPIKFGVDGLPLSSSTQPSLIIRMLDILMIDNGSNVLEIGTGSGYNAALMRHIVGKKGLVCSIDCETDVISQAKESLSLIGYDQQVKLISRDAWSGAKEHSPYDAVICTAACSYIPYNWFEQIKEGGQLIVPMLFKGLTFVCSFIKKQHFLIGNPVFPCHFMPLRGRLFNKEQQPVYIHGLHSYLNNFRSFKTKNEFLLSNRKCWNYQLELYFRCPYFRVMIEEAVNTNPDFETCYSFGEYMDENNFWSIQEGSVYYSNVAMLNNYKKTINTIDFSIDKQVPEIVVFFKKKKMSDKINRSDYLSVQNYSKENDVAFKFPQ